MSIPRSKDPLGVTQPTQDITIYKGSLDFPLVVTHLSNIQNALPRGQRAVIVSPIGRFKENGRIIADSFKNSRNYEVQAKPRLVKDKVTG